MAKKMTPAEQAYAAVQRAIAKALKDGKTELRFDAPAYHALDRIPRELRDLPEISALNLDNTAITDLSPLHGMTGLHQLFIRQTAITNLTPLQGLTGLRSLWLNQTAITDLTPLQGLTKLLVLSLDQTAVTDLAPLQGLTGLDSLFLSRTAITDLGPLRGMARLQTLELKKTKVRDLRPIIGLTALGGGLLGSFDFADTPATERDPQLQALSLLKAHKQRSRLTIAYLKTLPPWPEPLPGEAGDDPDPVVPQNVPAPLQIIERDGVLHPVLPGDALDDRGDVLARQGWAALRDYLADLADIKPRIENQIPGLSRALARFETALSSDYEQVNSVALGTHGQRVIRLAETAGETMSDADAAELQEFAVAVALFLERFPDWRAYRTAALTRPIDAKRVAETLPAIREIETLLIDQIGVDPAIPRTLRDLENASAEMPDDKITSHGLLDSVVNVVAAMGTVLWSGIKATGRGSKWFMQTFANKLAEKSAEKLVDLVTSKPVLLVAADLFINNARALKALAAAFPDQFSWVIGLLRAIGLG